MKNGLVKIVKNYPFSEYTYEKVPLTGDEADAARLFAELIHRKTDVEAFCRRFPKSSFEKIQAVLDEFEVYKINKAAAESENAFIVDLTNALDFLSEPNKIAHAILNELDGYAVLQPLLEDDELEEIMVNGTDAIFVHHGKYGVCKTNLKFNNAKELDDIVTKMGFDSKRDFADLTLSDGSRANVIAPPAVKEISITIRKFRKTPFSIIELIEKGTISLDLAAYLWVSVEGLSFFPLNIMIAGGTATGKTTLLNALTTFIPPSDRVITVEDTPELNFQRENWVQLLTTERLDLPGLVKNSLRMRPDRIIVGDIRGEEAFALFNAMNSGHRGAMGTLHANNDREVIKRLENEPMSVPRTLIPLADLVVVQEIVRDRRKGLIRRVTQVSEISRIEKEIALNPVFTWNIENDKIERTSCSSEAIAKIARVTHLSINQVKEKTDERRKLLNYMLENRITSQNDVNAFVEEYYKKLFEEEKDVEENGEGAQS